MVSQVVVGGILAYSSCVSNPGPNNAINAPELSIRTPKSAQGKSRCLDLCWSSKIHWWLRNIPYRTSFCCFHLIPLISLEVPGRTIARSQQDDGCQGNQPQNESGFPLAKARAPPNCKRKNMHHVKKCLRNAGCSLYLGFCLNQPVEIRGTG